MDIRRAAIWKFIAGAVDADGAAWLAFSLHRRLLRADLRVKIGKTFYLGVGGMQGGWPRHCKSWT
jgi:hypothetical protein